MVQKVPPDPVVRRAAEGLDFSRVAGYVEHPLGPYLHAFLLVLVDAYPKVLATDVIADRLSKDPGHVIARKHRLNKHFRDHGATIDVVVRPRKGGYVLANVEAAPETPASAPPAGGGPAIWVGADGSITYQGLQIGALPVDKDLDVLRELFAAERPLTWRELAERAWGTHPEAGTSGPTERQARLWVARLIKRLQKLAAESHLVVPNTLVTITRGRLVLARATPNNLTQDQPRLLGRDVLINDLVKLIDRRRLVTLRGDPGVGKSRIAWEVARRSLPAFGGGVYFVRLAELTRTELVLPAIAREMALPGGQEMVTEKIKASEHGRILLILDNLEQLLADGLASFINRLVDATPNVHVVATSTFPIGLAGVELVRPIPPLDLPEGDVDLALNPAIQLFLDQAVDTDGTLTELSDIGEICALMGGLPLGIRLAAAQTTMFSVAEILRRLRAEPWAADQGQVNPRQTLRGTIAWSFGLLTPPARRLFAWLAAFPAGVGLDSLGAVWAKATGRLGVHGQNSALDRSLDELVRSSLVHHERGDRYTMLEPIRRFGIEQLTLDQEDALAAEFQAEQSLRAAIKADALIAQSQHVNAMRQMQAERRNMAAALEWFKEARQGDAVFNLSMALAEFWILRGDWAEGRKAFEAALGDPKAGTVSQRASVFNRAGGLARNQGHFEIAREYYGTALKLAAPDDLWNRSYALNGLGRIEFAHKDFGRALARFDEALNIRRLMDKKAGAAVTLTNLGDLALATRSEAIDDHGHLDEAAKYYDEAHQIRHAESDAIGIAISHLKAGVISAERGELGAGLACMRDAVGRFQEIGSPDWLARSFEALAALAAKAGDRSIALVLWWSAVKVDEGLGTKKSDPERSGDAKMIEGWEASLDPGTAHLLRQRGAGLSLEGASSFAVSFPLDGVTPAAGACVSCSA